MRGLEATPAPLAASSWLSDPHPALSLYQASPWDTKWIYVEVTFLWSSSAQPSLQVTDRTFDLLHYPHQAHGARQTAWGSVGTSRQPNPVV